PPSATNSADYPGERLRDPESFHVSHQRFLQIGDRRVLGVAFAVCRNVGNTRGVASLLLIRDNFDR
ncbi:MAG TPA: hypothetical protein VK419_15090, partial [Bryobacteraceae bacterium]|nr:hypothetical protein [Bryobacteraceae bacterium]